MKIATHDGHRTVRDRIGAWWRRWCARAAGLGDLDGVPSELERVARETGVSVGDLRVLAGKWPDAGHLVHRRMAALGAESTQVADAHPAVMRDLQRVCSICGHERVCERDLGRACENPAWRKYCPNVGTLDALRPPNATPGSVK